MGEDVSVPTNTRLQVQQFWMALHGSFQIKKPGFAAGRRNLPQGRTRAAMLGV
jgi:hypothetical protein